MSLARFVMGLIGLVLLVVGVSWIGGGPVNDLDLYLPGIDKVLHFVGFALVGLICTRLARMFVPSANGLVVLVVLVLIAAGDEFLQGSMADRHRDVSDFLASASGAFLAMAWTSRLYRPRLAAATAFVAVLLGCLITIDTSYRQWPLNAAIRHERAGQLGSALRELRTAVARGNRSPGVLNELAWMELESGEGDARAALGYAHEALTLRPDDPDIQDTYGWALHHVGRSREALSYLEMALAKKPRIGSIHYHLGAAYLAVGEIDSARAHLLQQVQVPGTSYAARAQQELLRIEAAQGHR